MKRIVAALPIAVATAGLLAPAVSSAAGTAPPAAKTQAQKMQLGGHDGLCPFAASRADV